MIGPRYALRYPDRVRSLGLWSTAAFRTEDDSAKVMRRGGGDAGQGHLAPAVGIEPTTN
jgi:pimeloyl-ACP methyl ester carboxylesterase